MGREQPQACLENPAISSSDLRNLIYRATSALRPPGAERQPEPRTLHVGPGYQAVACDLLVVWDMLAIAASGMLSGLAYGHLQHPARLIVPIAAADPLPLVGVLLTPLLLYEGRPDPAAWTWRIAKTALRLIVLLSLVLAIRVMEGRWQPSLPVWLLVWFAAALPTMLAGRALLAAHIAALKRRRILAERVAIVGAGPLADQLAATLAHRPGPPVEIVGVFDDQQRSAGVAGAVRDLVELGKRLRFDRLFLVVPAGFGKEHAATVEALKALDAEIVAFSGPLGEIPTNRAADGDALPLIRLARRPIAGWDLVLKAAVDQCLGLLLLLGAAPVMALIALAVRLESPGPVIFCQRRHGLNNSEFEVLKFRTMRWQSAEAANGVRQTTRRDPRVTRTGRFLRKTSLDELPQLLNVLRGEMSLVGPRPHPVAMLTQGRLGSEILPDYDQRHRVKPGITGFAQINNCRGATQNVEQLRQRVEFDLAYIDRWSFLLDLKILALTPWRLLFPGGNAF